jgi:hypothetical protein
MCSVYEVAFMLKPGQKTSIVQSETPDRIAAPPVNELVADVHERQRM